MDYGPNSHTMGEQEQPDQNYLTWYKEALYVFLDWAEIISNIIYIRKILLFLVFSFFKRHKYWQKDFSYLYSSHQNTKHQYAYNIAIDKVLLDKIYLPFKSITYSHLVNNVFWPDHPLLWG